jgi:hypothetical protein
VKGWSRYDAASGDEPREALVEAARRFDAPGLAVDLGCGHVFHVVARKA